MFNTVDVLHVSPTIFVPVETPETDVASKPLGAELLVGNFVILPSGPSFELCTADSARQGAVRMQLSVRVLLGFYLKIIRDVFRILYHPLFYIRTVFNGQILA